MNFQVGKEVNGDHATPLTQQQPISPKDSLRPKRGRFFLVCILLLIGAGVAWRIANPPMGAGAPPGPPGSAPRDGMVVAVSIATAVKGDMPIVLHGLGTVTPLATVTIKSLISGYLTSVPFKEGDMVKKGDLIAQIDDRLYQASLAQYQGQLQKDQALLKNAELDLARYQKLNQQDSISKQNVDTQASTVQQYIGTVAADEAQVDTQKINIAYCHIVSPIDGRISLRTVDSGNYVTASDSTGIATVTQVRPISVIFTLPEDEVPMVSKRFRSGNELQVSAFNRTETQEFAKGTLATLDNQIDTSTGTLKLRALFDNKSDELFPNQFVNVHLLVDTLHDEIVVPSAAVLHGTPGDFVYRISKDDKVSVVKVTTGASDAGKIVIKSGLEEGDRIVLDGLDRLRDGAKIKIVGDSAKLAESDAK